MFRMCQMRNGGTFERIYRFLQSFLRFSVWPPMHSEPVFDSKPEECLSFGFSFLSFTLLICTELGMPACLPAFSPPFLQLCFSLSLCFYHSFVFFGSIVFILAIALLNYLLVKVRFLLPSPPFSCLSNI